jgi:hypothetical protein
MGVGGAWKNGKCFRPGGSGCGFSAWANSKVFANIAPVVVIMANARTILFILLYTIKEILLRNILKLCRILFSDIFLSSE